MIAGEWLFSQQKHTHTEKKNKQTKQQQRKNMRRKFDRTQDLDNRQELNFQRRWKKSQWWFETLV